jgi:hypothetical protein
MASALAGLLGVAFGQVGVPRLRVAFVQEPSVVTVPP